MEICGRDNSPEPFASDALDALSRLLEISTADSATAVQIEDWGERPVLVDPGSARPPGPPLLRPSSVAPAGRPLSEAVTRNRAQSLPPGFSEEELQGESEQEKARQRNKKAQRTFRQRQKAKAEHLEEELAAAACRISELEEHILNLQRLAAASEVSLGQTDLEERPLLAQVQASSSALQLEKNVILVRTHKLQDLYQQFKAQVTKGQPSSSPAMLPSPRFQAVDITDELVARSGFTNARILRRLHLQSVRPHAAWEGLTPVPMEELYSSILEGRMDLRLPLANGLAPERAIQFRHLVAMPVEQHLQLQAQYHECLAVTAPFCSDPHSAHGQHFQAVMGEAMALLLVFIECLPEEFLACQSISMVDRSTQMPPQAFENVKAASRGIVLSEEQLAAGLAIQTSYLHQIAACQAERQGILAGLQAAPGMPDASPPELSTPNWAASFGTDMGHLSNSHALQQEAYLHLIRSFVLHVLTPFDTGLLIAASYPYLVEFGAIIQHILSGPSNQAAPAGQG